MKKIICKFIILSILIQLCYYPINKAETVPSGTCGKNVTWKLYDNILVITGHYNNNPFSDTKIKNYSTSFDIPWYDYKDEIEKVIITGNVTNIGKNSFKDCYNLKKICCYNESVFSRILNIGESAFENCKNLKYVDIGKIGEIEKRSFYNCQTLDKMIISCNKVGEEAFYNCNSLKSISINANEIKSKAFYNCTSLINITFGEPPSKIGKYAFRGLSSNCNIWSNYYASTYLKKKLRAKNVGLNKKISFKYKKYISNDINIKSGSLTCVLKKSNTLRLTIIKGDEFNYSFYNNSKIKKLYMGDRSIYNGITVKNNTPKLIRLSKLNRAVGTIATKKVGIAKIEVKYKKIKYKIILNIINEYEKKEFEVKYIRNATMNKINCYNGKLKKLSSRFFYKGENQDDISYIETARGIKFGDTFSKVENLYGNVVYSYNLLRDMDTKRYNPYNSSNFKYPSDLKYCITYSYFDGFKKDDEYNHLITFYFNSQLKVCAVEYGTNTSTWASGS